MAALAVGLVLRVAFLGADASYATWVGWVTDEGRWTELAREWALFGSPGLDSPIARTHLILAPVFQAVEAVFFAIFGVSTVVARLVSVVAGLVVLGVAGWFLRSRIGSAPTALVVGLLAVHPDLVYFSRVAIPEMASLALQLVGFAFLVGAPRTGRRAFLAGIAVAAALGLKGTIVPLVPVFALVALLGGRTGDPSSRWVRCASFLAAILLPAAAFVVALGLATGSVSALFVSEGALGDILGFLTLDSAYGAVAVLYEGEWAVRVNAVILAVWALGLAFAVVRPAASEARTIFVASLGWAVGWILLWAVLAYFPERYVIHLHVPLIIAFGSGIAVLGELEEGALERGLAGLRSGAARWLLAAAAAVPASFVLVAAGLSWGSRLGAPTAGLVVHLIAAVGVAAGLGLLVARSGRPRALLLTGTALAAGMAAAWCALNVLGSFQARFWSGDPGAAFAWGGVAAVGLGTAWIVSRGSRGSSAALGRLLVGYAAVLTVVWVGDRADRMARRTYVLDDVRSFLAEHYGPETVIGVRGTASILIDTAYPVRQLLSDNQPTDVILILEGEEPFFALPSHREVVQFMLPLGPRYYYDEPPWERIRVYERIEAAPVPPPMVRPGSP
jgi:hypothetical protein